MAILGQDSFTRTISNGWGAADVGGTWSGTEQYASSGRSVNGATGILTPSNGWGGDMLLSAQARDVAMQVSYTVTAAAGGGVIYVGLKARVSGSSDYEIAAVHHPDGFLDLTVYQDTASTVLATTRLPYAAWTTLSTLYMKAEVFGAAPATIRGKLWPEGSPEPGWQISHDATPAGTLGSAGILGIEAYRDPGGTGNVTVSFDDYQAADWTSQPDPEARIFIGEQPVTAIYLGTTPVTPA